MPQKEFQNDIKSGLISIASPANSRRRRKSDWDSRKTGNKSEAALALIEDLSYVQNYNEDMSCQLSRPNFLTLIVAVIRTRHLINYDFNRFGPTIHKNLGVTSFLLIVGSCL